MQQSHLPNGAASVEFPFARTSLRPHIDDASIDIPTAEWLLCKDENPLSIERAAIIDRYYATLPRSERQSLICCCSVCRSARMESAATSVPFIENIVSRNETFTLRRTFS